MKKIIIIAIIGLFFLPSCEMDFLPNEKIAPEQLENDPSGAIYATDGNYAMFKDRLIYAGSDYPGNTYVRHFFQMAEFPADNVCLAGRTTDPLYEALTYKRTPGLYNLTYLWYVSYKIINGAAVVIESLPEGVSSEMDHIKGENHFLRAISYFNLSNLWSKPYVLGRDNPGVVLHKSTDTKTVTRSTVGDVYDFVVEDLKEAIRLMSGRGRRHDAGYASKEAAQALLARVYLYMGDRDNEVITLTSDMLGANPEAKLESTANFPNYFANALTSKETLWAVAHTTKENRGGSAIGSMFLTAGVGWGEVYSSDPLNDLYERNPNDVRYGFVVPKQRDADIICWGVLGKERVRNVFFDNENNVNKYYFTEEGTKTYVETEGETEKYIIFNGTKEYVRQIPRENDIRWAVMGGEGHQENELHIALFDDVQNNHYFLETEEVGEYKSTRIYVETETNVPPHGTTENYITLVDGTRHRARLTIHMEERYGWPKYFVTKFSYQDGEPMLSSPVMLRWAEVLLNRAEAYARTNQPALALADVNVIRERAGLSGTQLFSTSNMQGYTDVLDIVLDERRLEFAFEGHRMFDVYRNKKNMDRRFSGVQTYEIVNYDDNKIQYPIPQDEINASKIPQNPI